MIKRKRVTILGSTGSIGKNCLDIIASNLDKFELSAITAYGNLKELVDQVIKFRPKLAVIGNASLYSEAKEMLSGYDINIELAAGEDAVTEAALYDADIIISAIVGIAGLKPTLNAIRDGVIVGIANKESLVCAGGIINQKLKSCNCVLVPIDSEHNAIYRHFNFDKKQDVEKIYLTASGGPFLHYSDADLLNVTVDQALNHPTWNMGRKISIDSATMMNKGLELIEAYYLFPVREEQIEIIIHPSSVIHSMVSYIDGSVSAELGVPDMRTPISYILSYPDKIFIDTERLDLVKVANLEFFAPDENKFPALRIAREVLLAGGAAPVIMNAANEIAVESFLGGKIKFLDIVKIVEDILADFGNKKIANIDDVMLVNIEAKEKTKWKIQNRL